MNKKVLVIVLAVVVVVGVIAIGIMKFVGSSSSYSKDFGKDTYKNLDEGKYILACDDAKTLVRMIRSMNEDFEKNPDLAGVADISRDNMTESMKVFETAMDSFTNNLETRYQDNRTLRDQVFAGIGEGFSNIFQLTIMLHLDMVKPEDVDKYVDIEFCGKKAPEGYVSPLEQAVAPMGEEEIVISPDNSTTK